MISTLLNYRLYTNNMARTLEQLSDQAQTARAKDYYDAHIGTVASVDDFLDDYKLYSYAMKAYGLEDQIGSKGLMRKVLESDLTDPNSFANKLTDKRYQAFAKAFDFTQASGDSPAQTTGQSGLVTEAYTERLSRTGPAAAAAAAGFTTALGSTPGIDGVLSTRATLDFALRAVGIDDPSLFSTDYVRSVLEGKAATPIAAGLADLRARFEAVRTGTTSAADMTGRLVYDYYNETGNGSSPAAAQANVDDFTRKVTSTQTAAAFVADDRLLRTALTAVGFELTSYSADFVLPLLKDSTKIDALSGVSDLDKQRFRTLSTTLGFDSSGAATKRGADAVPTLTANYLKSYQTAQTGKDTLATRVYLTAIADVRSVSDLTRNAATISYALKAFDIDPAGVSLNKLRAILTSDPSDPKSYVAKLKDERFSRFAAAFNFGADGKTDATQSVQTTAQQTGTGTLYAASFGTNLSDAKKALVKSATEGYLLGISKAYSLDTLLADRKTVDYALTAYGVENKDLSTAELRKILTSDLADPKSYANSHPDKAVAKFAAAFEFEADGTVRQGTTGAQGGAAKLATDNLYLLQTLEGKAGETSEGTRLALYALRTAPSVTSVYGILGDKALFEVVRTALQLPTGMSSLDIEAQAKILEAKLDVKDFADPKTLDKFISRFAGLYDLANPDTTSNPILQLFGGGSSGGILSLI